MKEQISYIGYKKDFYTGKITQYISEFFQRKGNDYRGVVYKYGYINKYPNKTKGWFKLRTLYGQWLTGYEDIIWEEGITNLDIKSKINESKIKLVKESLNEELLGVVDHTDTEIYKNPPSIKHFEHFVRAISDDKGNLFVAHKEWDVIHPNIYYWLIDNKFMKNYRSRIHGADCWDVAWEYDKIILWQRIGKTNNFTLGESYNFDEMDDSDFNKLELLADKVRKKNPKFNFILKYDKMF
jgi:hypothetical protein